MCEKNKFDFSKLRGRMVEKYGTIEKTAEAAGLRRDTLSLALNGKRTFTQSEIVILTKALDIPSAEVGLYFFRT